MPKKKNPTTIASEIHQKYILSGSTRVGNRLPTVRALAADYGVSNATIVHALILMEQAKLIDRRHGSGNYVLAKDTTEKKKCEIAFIRPNYRGDSVIPRIFAGIEAAAAKSGLTLTIRSSGDSVEEEREVILEMNDAGFDGTILYPQPRITVKPEGLLNQKFEKMRLILIDLASDNIRRSRVVFDNYEAGFEMTKNLIEAGRRNIGFWMQHVDASAKGIPFSIEQRFKGYQDCLSQHSIQPKDEWIWHDVWTSPSAAQDESLLWGNLLDWKESELDQRIDALLSLDDVRAGIAINAARNLKIEVPNDIAITGFDNVPSIQQVFNHGFPTTKPNFFRAGELALSLLLREIKEDNEHHVSHILASTVHWPENYLKQ